jgi:Fur family zinc uptake transcriptional regulator
MSEPHNLEAGRQAHDVGADTHHNAHADGEQHGHGHAFDAKAVFQRAEAYAERHGLKVTPIRSEVLSLLLHERKPLSAYQIVDRLSAGRKLQAVQVYRALEFLQDAACVHRLASRSSYVACDHEHADGEAVVFMICSACGSVAEAPSETIARGLAGMLKEAGFKPATPILEIEGQCPNCAGIASCAGITSSLCR